MKKKDNTKNDFINPVDKDKVTENPGTLPYAHNIGSAIVRPINKKGEKGTALAIMEEQADIQLKQIKDQVELLVKQAKSIKERVEISQIIYEADINFQPVVGDVYHLYQKQDGSTVISMISPHEWGKKMPYNKFLKSIKLLSDRTWLPIE